MIIADTVTQGKESYVLHKQQALTANSSTLMDLSKKKKFEKAKKMVMIMPLLLVYDADVA